jgi:hypothetical protein
VKNNNLFAQAVIAGIIAGIIVDAFVILVEHAPFPGVYQFIASGIVGQDAFTSRSYIALGLGIHFLISIVSALAYAYIGSALHLLSRWIIGGTILGVVVMLLLQVILVSRLHTPIPDTKGIIMGLIAHVIFFGLPIAWYISRSTSLRSARA